MHARSFRRSSGIDVPPGMVRHVDAVFGRRKLRFAFPGSATVPSELWPAMGDPAKGLERLKSNGWQFEHVYYPILHAYPDLPAEHVTRLADKVSRVDDVLRSRSCAIENYAPLAAKILQAGLAGLDPRHATFDDSWPG